MLGLLDVLEGKYSVSIAGSDQSQAFVKLCFHEPCELTDLDQFLFASDILGFSDFVVLLLVLHGLHENVED